MAGLFVRLKLRLLAGNLRAGGARSFAFVASAVAAGIVAVVGFLQLAILRTEPDELATDRGIATLTSLFVAWMLLPLLAFGQDETLDPARLALFPLRPRQLAVGLVAASATGPWPLATLVVLGGAVVGLAHGPGGVLLGLLTIPVFLGLCLGTSRLMTTALSRMLRSRRGRDLVALVMGLLVVVSQVPNLLLQRGVSTEVDSAVHEAARVLRWTPSGMAAHAMAYGGWVGLAELAGLTLLVVAVIRLWVTVLQRALVAPDTSTERTVRRTRGQSRLLRRLLPDGPLAAVTAKELRYARRDPRRRVTWVSSIAMSGVLSFTLTGSDGISSPRVVLPAACLIAGVITAQAGNVLGFDGRFLWFNTLAYRDQRDLRADFAGRHLAFTIVALPLLAAMALALGLLVADPLSAIPAVLTASGVLGVGLGVNAMMSVKLPYAVPDQLNAFSNAAPGQGCVSGISGLGTLVATALLVLPFVLPVAFGLTGLCVVAPLVGLVGAWVGRTVAARIGYPRLPELLAAVSRPA